MKGLDAPLVFILLLRSGGKSKISEQRSEMVTC